MNHNQVLRATTGVWQDLILLHPMTHGQIEHIRQMRAYILSTLELWEDEFYILRARYSTSDEIEDLWTLGAHLPLRDNDGFFDVLPIHPEMTYPELLGFVPIEQQIEVVTRETASPIREYISLQVMCEAHNEASLVGMSTFYRLHEREAPPNLLELSEATVPIPRIYPTVDELSELLAWRWRAIPIALTYHGGEAVVVRHRHRRRIRIVDDLGDSDQEPGREARQARGQESIPFNPAFLYTAFIDNTTRVAILTCGICLVGCTAHGREVRRLDGVHHFFHRQCLEEIVRPATYVEDRTRPADLTCGICLTGCSGHGREARRMRLCHHIFHRECLHGWVRSEIRQRRYPNCPVCRGRMY